MFQELPFETPPPWCAYVSSLSVFQHDQHHQQQEQMDDETDDDSSANNDDDDDDVILLTSKFCCDRQCSIPSLRTVVEIVVNDVLIHTTSDGTMNKPINETTNVIQVHPLLASGFLERYNFQSQNHQPSSSESKNTHDDDLCQSFLLQPYPSLHYEATMSLQESDTTKCVPIHAQKISKMKIDPKNMGTITISLSIIYTTLWSKAYCSNDNNFLSEEQVKIALEGRIILSNSVVLLCIVNGANPSPDSDFALVHIQKVTINSTEQKQHYDDSQYLVLGPNTSYTVNINHTSFQQLEALQKEEHQSMANDIICPGYETLVNEICDLAYLQQISKEASPSAVLITGCAGVGKTQLALAVASELCSHVSNGATNSMETNFTHRIISAKDIILKASTFVDESELIKYIFPQTTISSLAKKNQILILDDLQELFRIDNDTNDTLLVDWERMISCNAILSAIDNIIHFNSSFQKNKHSGFHQIFVLGSYQTTSSNSSFFHPKLTRVGRFEKIVNMATPTENQRIQMLDYLFKQMGESSSTTSSNGDNSSVCERNQQCSVALAPLLAGCVASDMKRMCTDAWTRSRARTQNNCVQHNDSGNMDVVNSDGNEQFIWEDIEEAARKIIPSQLALLDVTIASKMKNSLQLNNPVQCSPKEAFLECWNDFGGYEETKEKIYRTIVAPWRRIFSSIESNDSSQPQKSPQDWFVPPPSGVIFHGPSGTGKTLAAQCLASSLGLNVIKVRASDILDKWLGGSEAAIRSLFSRARSAAPCILFFDEIDALASNRENVQNDDASCDVHSRILSTMLNEMDGISSTNAASDDHSMGTTNRILVMAATNRLSAIDSALLRPGRFEEHISLRTPTIDDINGILSLKLENIPLCDDIDLKSLVESLHDIGATGADIEGICTDSCLDAIHELKNNDGLSAVDSMSLTNKNFEKIIAQWKD